MVKIQEILVKVMRSCLFVRHLEDQPYYLVLQLLLALHLLHDVSRSLALLRVYTLVVLLCFPIRPLVGTQKLCYHVLVVQTHPR